MVKTLIFSAINHSVIPPLWVQVQLRSHVRQAKFCLVRGFFSGISHFRHTYRLTRLKMTEIILTDCKTQINNPSWKSSEQWLPEMRCWLSVVSSGSQTHHCEQRAVTTCYIHRSKTGNRTMLKNLGCPTRSITWWSVQVFRMTGRSNRYSSIYNPLHIPLG